MIFNPEVQSDVKIYKWFTPKKLRIYCRNLDHKEIYKSLGGVSNYNTQVRILLWITAKFDIKFGSQQNNRR